jgi:hypothetical protein
MAPFIQPFVSTNGAPIAPTVMWSFFDIVSENPDDTVSRSTESADV